ncbi:MAG: hypothetical protein JSS53_07035 [Proteobacteria bacterium]|nr:hypothetical protein [Pseudomonadota bacterium]
MKTRKQWTEQELRDGYDLAQKLRGVFEIVQKYLDALSRDALSAKARGEVVDNTFEKELRTQSINIGAAGTLNDCSSLFIFLAKSSHPIAKEISKALGEQHGIDVKFYLTAATMILSGAPCMYSVPRGSTCSGVIRPVHLPLSLMEADGDLPDPFKGKGDSSSDDEGNTAVKKRAVSIDGVPAVSVLSK